MATTGGGRSFAPGQEQPASQPPVEDNIRREYSMEDGCVYHKLGSLFLFTPPQKHFYQMSVLLSLSSLLSSLCLSGGKVLLRISPIVYSSPKIA